MSNVSGVLVGLGTDDHSPFGVRYLRLVRRDGMGPDRRSLSVPRPLPPLNPPVEGGRVGSVKDLLRRRLQPAPRCVNQRREK